MTTLAERLLPPQPRHSASRVKVGSPVLLVSLALGAFAIGTAEFAAMTLMPEIATGLGISEPSAAHIVSVYALGVVVGAPTIAISCARVPRHRLLVGLMITYALGNALSAFAPSLPVLLALRFASGLPHGAYLGVAALAAAGLVEHDRRARAVSMVMLGLTVAMIVGVAVATAIGQVLGWRWGFALPSAIATAVAVSLAAFMPRTEGGATTSPLDQVNGLGNPQIWLTLLTGAIGFSGFFAVYAFTASTLVTVTGFARAWVPVLVALFGVGMTLGTIAAGKAADRHLMMTPAVFLAGSVASLVAFTLLAHDRLGITLAMLAVGFFAATSGALQTRLMDVAGRAQTAAAVLNHSAFNVANAMGPLFAGAAVARGYGYASVGLVGAVLTAGGLLVWILAWHAAVRGRPMSASNVSRGAA